MPVFTRMRGGVLVVTVDGDFTPGEGKKLCYPCDPGKYTLLVTGRL